LGGSGLKNGSIVCAWIGNLAEGAAFLFEEFESYFAGSMPLHFYY
jgi:hypothetical protein